MIVFPDHFLLSSLNSCQIAARFNMNISQKVDLCIWEIRKVWALEAIFFSVIFEEL